ncbi:RHS repeat-associated core domain-containing protein [Epilithonimonas pallida]|uniref:RHS repeat-associated core domain-containing protein n=1 Tax=Epilithonimonas pallida TaxID=373671 RepID=A0ABY1QZS7_9FLAO|nr:RHS repeat-associated core domain-containing protein [Epilithonimonas pallida]SMP90873.1 RHS repeat-associated core domain-containing protein [Epilithonimonas pallida]
MKNNKILLSPKNAGFFLITSSLLFTLSSWSLNNIKKENGQSKSHNIQYLRPFRENNNSKKGSAIFSNIVKTSDHPIENILPRPSTETNLFEGSIGSADPNNWYDEASDNVFNVTLDNIDHNKEYVLTYQVQGLDNIASVTRSINQSLSLGGYVQSKSEKWNIVKENIDPTLLKKGVNHILFNANGKKNFYRIKDVKIVENTNKTADLFKINSKIYKDNTFYLRGFVNSNSNITTIQILDKNIKLEGNEFEYFDEKISLKTELNIKFKNNHGNIVANKTIKLDNQEKTFETVSYNAAKEKIVYNNKYGYLIGLRAIDSPPVDPSITNLAKDFYGYRYKSSTGTPSIIHIPYNKNLIPKGYSEADIAAFRFDYNKKRWERIKYDSINVENEYLIVKNEGGGDTDYVNGIIKNPQSPETSSFTPTTINDIPVANPVSNVNLIAPPKANQQGSANVQYPIEIPAGVNGLQPNVSINYNSDSKNGGWAGIGWDVSAVETIDIDTRWGVPEFNDEKETEIYSIGGEQLVFDDGYLPTKITKENPFLKPRVSGDKLFYFRTGVKEGIKITRKNSSTSTYTWEITDNSGTKKEYNDFLKDATGNIVKWYLSKVTDRYGNEAVYQYEEIVYNNGRNKYLSKITYSNTIIEFNNQQGVRPDVTSSHKLGVKISDFKLLENITIKRANTIVRQYSFLYNDGDFGKKLLSQIIQKDKDENVFNKHSLGYNRLDGHIFSEEGKKDIFAGDDNLTSGNFDEGQMSVISGTQGKSTNWKGAVTFGASKKMFWLDLKKSGTIGLNYSYTENENFGKSQLMDIDGDGLPDKVFYKDGGTIKYRRNLGNSFGAINSVSGFSNIPLSKNNAYVNSFGIEFSWKFIQGGISYSTTNSNSPIYFSDVNADGLSDLVYYGKVFFNKMRINSSNNDYNDFAATEDNSTALLDTPNPILKGIDAPKTTTPESESNMLANIVRVWEAPVTGNINIAAAVSLNQISTDGVKIWIEKGSVHREVDNINENDIQPSTIISGIIRFDNNNQSGGLSVSTFVKKGQRIYLIASSIDNAKGDKILVDSNIQYTDKDLNLEDANGYKYFKSNFSDTFLSSDNKGAAIGDKGKINIDWNLMDDIAFTDDVEFKIYKSERRSYLQNVDEDADIIENRTLIFHHKLNRGSSLNGVTSLSNILNTALTNIPVNQSSIDGQPTITILNFEVSSDTNITWDKINWKPKIDVISLSQTTSINATVQYLAFPERLGSTQFYTNNVENIDSLNIAPTENPIYFPGYNSCYNQPLSIPTSISPENNLNGKKVTFSIKIKNFHTNQNTIIPLQVFKRTVTVQNNSLPIPYIVAPRIIYSDEQAYFEIHTDSYELSKYLLSLNSKVRYAFQNASNCTNSFDSVFWTSYYSFRAQTKHYNSSMGQMWQGWGGFSYNASKYPDNPLREREFFVEANDNTPYFPEPTHCGNPDTPGYEDCMLNFVKEQQNKRYFTSLVLDPEQEIYTSPMESAFQDRNYMQPYNLLARTPSVNFEGDPSFATEHPTGIISHSKASSLNIYGSIAGGGASGGYSKDETSEFFQDFNGDQYPDIVVGNQYYKTTNTGALTNAVTIASGDKTMKNKTVNGGVSFPLAGGSINSEKASNTLTSGFTSFGELNSQFGSSFSATGVGLNGSIGGSRSENENIWLDINGDSLMDYIANGNVYVNDGKQFVFEPDWNVGSVYKNESIALSGGGGVNLGQGSWVVGVGKNFSFSKTKVIFIDLTGDGLVDKLERDNNHYKLFVNTGQKISRYPIDMGDIDFEIKNDQNSMGYNFMGTLCPVIFFFKICVSFGAGKDKSTNKQTVELRDFDGDGLADILLSNNNAEITVFPNQANKSNLLTEINNPLGGTIFLNYDNVNPNSHIKIGNTYQMPYSKQVLTGILIDNTQSQDGLNLSNKSLPPAYKRYLFEYENGVQDRRERAFLGFGKVKSTDYSGGKGVSEITEYETNYSSKQDFYVPYSDSAVRKYFYKKGLVKSVTVMDSLSRPRSVVKYTYNYFDQAADTYTLSEGKAEPVYKDIGRIIPLLYKTETTTTEYNGSILHSKKLISTIEQYDKYGNVLKYTDRGKDITDTTDDIKVTITYHPVTSKNAGGIPYQHTVTNSAGVVLRKSQTTIDTDGNITNIKRQYGNKNVDYNYEYDSYGNLTKSIFPLDQNDQRMFYQYEYDPVYHTYITKVTDAYGYTSKTQYDDNYLFGVPKKITDLNNVVSEYTYDSFGRMTQYKSPFDNDWTIKLHYYTEGTQNANVAITERKAPTINGVTPTINYFSSLFTDYWGEELATKKLAGGESGNYIYTFEKSPIKDIRGRNIKAFINKLALQSPGDVVTNLKTYYPQLNEMLNSSEFQDYYITYKYDELNRPVKSIQKGVLADDNPNNTLETKTTYGFGADKNGEIQFTKTIETPRGAKTTTYTDERGRTTSVKQTGDNTNLWTSYNYDLLGQLIKVTDQNSKNITYSYDGLGRRISENHPDAGLSNYTYDEANHLIAFDNPVLRESGHEILYTYNYNQLTKITYPDHIVKYEYGLPGAVNNGAGRLIKQTDRTGIQMFKYSRLGQLTEEKRFMIAPNETAKVFKTSYDYDVYNRINKIVYPDNEEVLYSYNPFGLLNGIQSIMPTTGATSNIVSSISYDYNDQMTSVTAGNGTVTEYQRDPWGRLEKLMLNAPISLTSLGEIIRSNAYTYDKDNNVTGIITAVPMGINNTVLNGVASEKTFTYDGFNRLKTSLIKATGPDEKKYYQLDMAYNNSHGIASKHSRWKTYRSDVCSNPAKEGANMVYHYDDTNHPNAVSSITSTIGGRYTTPWDCGTGFNVSAMDTNEYYTYDANGNMTLVENEASQDPFSLPERTVKRQLFWDTQNHLKGIAQDNALHHYVYDAGGERSLKSEGIVRNIFTNGNVGSGRPRTTMEPYTYYPNGYAVVNGAQLSKHYYIGSNKIAAKVTDLPSHGFASELTPTLNELSATSMREVESMIQEAGYPPVAWANIDDSTLETEETCSNAVLAAASNFNPKTNCYKKLMAGYNAALQTGTVCEFWHNFQLDDCMINQPNDEELESQTYWVHPDHLGSGSVITNQSGNTTNWYEYMPFGEMLMEQSNGDYNNVYKYNGKELDDATQLYYYGARYYDPNTSVWLSVDPLAIYHPVMETEFYGDGQHNGGVFNSGNLNAYIYCYQNPVIFVDPNGKQSFAGALRGVPYGQLNNVNKGWRESLRNGGGYQMDFVPLFGDFKGAIEGIAGTDMQGNKLSGTERFLSILLLSELKDVNNAYRFLKLTTKGIDYALNDVSRLQHAFKHAKDIKEFASATWNKNTREAWKAFNSDILSTATKTFENVLGGTKVKGFYKKVDGQDIATYIYAEGKNKGKIATTVVLNENQMKKFKLK